MATATKKARVASSVSARDVSESSLEFLIYRDNAGSYHWEIVEGSESLVHSVSFSSHEDAERAARHVYERAGLAHFGPSAADGDRPTAA
jgi:uncharacterized protein YegP (UPF0339 family)